ncbi:hypothetical protein FOZ61_004569 [Perkinsus olseni]|uniref:Uncharacterized protein n=1 Tax=Perkinsus olseni TaxID=32597 RepID=A0A7J6MCJ6_PEROL|nr:hypothetical protein FOZ61_004569 [Perkinsus olseni]
MLFCDRRSALTLDLRLMDSLWLRKDCNVGPMVELQSVIQEFIGPDSHQTSLDCFTETFHIAKKPDAFIVRNGELIGIYIEEERITLRSVLENNRFVMELDPPCPKGSFIDFSADEDRLTAFDRKANRLYLYDLGKGRCTSVVEIRGLALGACLTAYYTPSKRIRSRLPLAPFDSSIAISEKDLVIFFLTQV